MMLAWVPFRAENINVAFQMWSKVLNPYDYTCLGMRENTYLITTLILFGIFIIYFIRKRIITRFNFSYSSLAIADIFSVGIMVSLVIIFLRPVNQFIYFQF